MKWHWLVLAAAVGLCGSSGRGADATGGDALAAMRQKAGKLFSGSNWKEAYDAFRLYLLKPVADERALVEDLDKAVNCLRRLGREKELDAFFEEMVSAHPGSWRIKQGVARGYLNANHMGFMVAGQFERGPHRGGGEYVSSFERDRARALQLYEAARPLAAKDGDKGSAASFMLDYARTLMSCRGGGGGWRLQYATDFAVLPDYDKTQPYWGYRRGEENKGAPVDEKNEPVFHRCPDSYDTAATDGERWRWLLKEAANLNPNLSIQSRRDFADFVYSQFGTHTLADYGYYFMRPAADDATRKDTSGTYELHTLKETETIAKLATGIRRFALPDEFNYLKLYQALSGEGDEQSSDKVATTYENRRQYPAAAAAWAAAIKKHGAGGNAFRQKKHDQIVKNWGEFEPVMSQPAGGKGATVEYRYRNATSVKFEARRVKIDELLADVKAYLKSDPVNVEWDKIQIENLGWRLVQKDPKYIGDVAAAWDLELKPMPDHFDKRITIKTPLKDPGAYFVTARLADGNESRILLWVENAVIVRKPLAEPGAAPKGSVPADNGGALYFLADAVTGEPLSGAQADFFGWWQVPLQKREGRRYAHVKTTEFVEKASVDGLIVPPRDRMVPSPNHGNPQFLITAKTADGKFAFMGFDSVWWGNWYDAEYNETKVYGITDRPVYRPKQKVQYKFWVTQAQYDREGPSPYAGQSLRVEARNAKDEKIFEKAMKADRFGGLNGEFELPAGAALGIYNLQVWSGGNIIGGQTFRVEEYKKPEFEVVVEAPAEPVMLGEKVTAVAKAKYYFGAPVTEGKVKVKVERSKYSADWYPFSPWDWFYGPGYWWFGYDYDWYPGWAKWGCWRPLPWWAPHEAGPPELVMDRELQIGADGEIKIEIDTAVAKAMHADSDHKYSITVEVTDNSRRTITGQGQVLVAREPFKVYAWVDRGHYRPGDVVLASFRAATLDQKPVQGKGRLALFRISYDADRKPVETAVQKWDLDTDVEGRSKVQIMASKAGQYRLSYTVTDAKKHAIEGGYVFVVRGEGDDGKDYRFNQLELVADQPDYQPGERVSLLVNTDRPGGTVLLFVRPASGAYIMPRVLRLKGRSATEAIEVVKRDMPNFFVEAVTVADGKVYNETREICVPPEKRVLNVEVKPDKAEYKPGEQAKVHLKVTDFEGKPFAGSLVMAVYDRAVEYISGGSNVPEIKEFFWKWRRHHNPVMEHSLARWCDHIPKQNEIGMGNIGVFGATVADELNEMDDDGQVSQGAVRRSMSMNRSRGFGGGAAGGEMLALGAVMDAAAPMPAAPMAAMEMAPGAVMAKTAVAPMVDMAGGGEAQPAVVQPTVRKEFADTAYWTATTETDPNGVAELSFKMPENLTGWKFRTWAIGDGTRVGEATTEAVTVKNLLLRLQAPRFFVEKDEVVLSANIHNYLDKAKKVTAVLELEKGALKAIDKAEQVVEIPAKGEKRVDWRVKAVLEGEAVVRMKALTDEESDAMEMKFPVHVHGIEKMESWSGVIRPEKTLGKVEFRVPAERRPDQTRLEVRWSPTLAGAMVDALPYLLEYPYGCTEQTLSRFLPAVLTRKVLTDIGVDLEAIGKKRTNLNAMELGLDAERAKQWKRYGRDPVFDTALMEDIVNEGLQALYDMQLRDGGWGWFSGEREHSYPHTTVHVMHGLQVAKASGLKIRDDVLQRGLEWLKRYQKEEIAEIRDKDHGKDKADNLDAYVAMVLADGGFADKEMLGYLDRDRGVLAVYGLALYGLALDRLGDAERRDTVIRNIEQYLVEDPENQSAYLKLGNEGYWWCWYGSEYEAHAFYLKLLARTAPKSPKAAGLVKYLLNNRKHATYWNSTRDTALCVEAMADYLKASGEDKPDLTLEVLVDGKPAKTVRMTAENLFGFDNKLVLEGESLTAGHHTVELKKTGTGPVYFNAYLTNFTLEDPIAKAGLEIKVERKFYKLVPEKKTIKVQGARGQALDQRVEKFTRIPLKDGEVLKSGDLIEVEMEIASKNDYEYLVFEDMKAAGCEAVEVRSGYNGNAMGAYVEFRDERTAFFVRALARGNHSVAYRLRAEIPGRFSALPVRGWAMYAPELKANSDEFKVKIEDK